MTFTVAKPALFAALLLLAPAPLLAQYEPSMASGDRSEAPEAAAVLQDPAADVGRISRPTAEPASPDQAEAVVAALPSAAATPALFVNDILVDPDGMTLYVFDRDTRPGVSTCTRICEQLWPPYYARLDSEPVGEFAVVHRIDGSLQWSHRDRPLYYWAHDRKPGDITGDAVNDVWWIVRQ